MKALTKQTYDAAIGSCYLFHTDALTPSDAIRCIMDNIPSDVTQFELYEDGKRVGLVDLTSMSVERDPDYRYWI